MYMYEKFFPVTKVHGYKIISIQRLAPSHSPPRPNPPAPRHQPSAVERAPWVQNSPASVPGRLDGAATDLAACLLPFPAASPWSWGEQMSFSSFGKMFFGGMDERVSRYPFRDGPDVRVTQRHL